METILKLSNKNWLLDTANKRITFLDSRFYFDEHGTPVPSVTTVLECYPKGAEFYAWLKKHGENADEIRDEAGRKGSVVHHLTERYEYGEEVTLFGQGEKLDFSMMEWAMFERYVEFRKRYDIEVHSIEKTLVSSELGLGGTLDRDWTINGKRYLTDIKTSGNIWDEYWLQLTAYERMVGMELGHNPYDGVAILWLNAKTRTDGRNGAIQGKGWQLIINDSAADREKWWSEFQATQMLWNAKNAGTVPRQMSYQLSHCLK